MHLFLLEMVIWHYLELAQGRRQLGVGVAGLGGVAGAAAAARVGAAPPPRPRPRRQATARRVPRLPRRHHRAGPVAVYQDIGAFTLLYFPFKRLQAVGVLCAATGCWLLPAKLSLCRVVDAWRLPLCAALMLLAGALAVCLAALACLSQHGQRYWMFILSLASLALVMLVGGAWQTVEQRATLAFVPAAHGARILPPPAAPLPSGLVLVPGAARDTMSAVMHAALSRYSTDLQHSWDSLQRSLQTQQIAALTAAVQQLVQIQTAQQQQQQQAVPPFRPFYKQKEDC